MKKPTLLIFLFLFLLPANAWALSPDDPVDKRSILFDTVYYDTRDVASGCGTDVPTSADLPADTVSKINKLKDIYVKAGQETNVPWQVLAAIHYREAQNDEKGDLQAGNSFNQKGSQFSSQGVQPDLQTSAINAGKELQEKAQSGIYKQPIVATSPDAELIKDALFGYNGRADAYARQAAALGFDPKLKPYEGSPYVMNQFDEKHKNMKLISHDFGSADAIDTRLGAFTVYARLGGAIGNCAGGASGSHIVDIARAELAKDVRETPDGCNCGPDIDKYTDHHPEFWCADFVSWVYKEAGAGLTGGESGGWRIPGVLSLKAWFEANGTFTANIPGAAAPQPGDVIFFNDASADSSDGKHTGIVETVEGAKVTVIEGNASNAVRRRGYENYTGYSKIMGWGQKK